MIEFKSSSEILISLVAHLLSKKHQLQSIYGPEELTNIHTLKLMMLALHSGEMEKDVMCKEELSVSSQQLSTKKMHTVLCG